MSELVKQLEPNSIFQFLARVSRIPQRMGAKVSVLDLSYQFRRATQNLFRNCRDSKAVSLKAKRSKDTNGKVVTITTVPPPPFGTNNELDAQGRFYAERNYRVACCIFVKKNKCERGRSERS